jgi:hypothetical protein
VPRFNADTYEYQDKLVIVSDKGGGTMIEATLDMDNESLYTRQESGNSKPLRVEICSQVYSNSSNEPDYMLVSIGYSSSTLCNQQQPVATTATSTATSGLQHSVLSAFTDSVSPPGAKCMKKGKDCSYDEECCSNTCHNDKCGGESKIRDTSAYRLGEEGGRVRGTGGNRGLRGL